jgi:hypothetical protein
MAPITIEAYDNNGQQLFSYEVAFDWEINVEQLLERAFAQQQSAATPDPFTYTVAYYGYSQSADFPGYLGYELESIGSLSSSSDFYWSLSINDQPSPSGIDTTFPNPGSTVTFRYTPSATATSHEAGRRLKEMQPRRAARAQAARAVT